MKRRAKTLLLTAAALILFAACNVLEPSISDEGVVAKLEIGSGCWVIEANQTTYLPANFPIDLRVEDLRVQFEAEPRSPLSSTCPGFQIDLVWIEALAADGSDDG